MFITQCLEYTTNLGDLRVNRKKVNYIKRKHSIKKVLELAEDFKITMELTEKYRYNGEI